MVGAEETAGRGKERGKCVGIVIGSSYLTRPSSTPGQKCEEREDRRVL